MSLEVFNAVAQKVVSGDVQIMSEPAIEVRRVSDNALVSLYEDSAGATSLGNPYTADTDGIIQFYVESDKYNVTATKDTDTITWPDVLIGQDSRFSDHTEGSTETTVSAALNARVIKVASVAEGFSGLSGVDGFQYSAAGGLFDGDLSGGIYEFDSSVAKSNHDGVAYVSPTVPAVSAQAGATEADKVDAFKSGTGETDPSGDGVFVLTSPQGRFYGNDGKKYQVVAAVLRQTTTGSGWFALDDSGHTPIGIDTVETSVDGMSIQVNYNFTSSAIGSLNVNADESFAAFPMYFGATVASTYALIDFFHDWGLRTNGTATATTGPMGTKGVDWDATVDTSAGTITVSHGTQTHGDASGWPVSASIYTSGSLTSISDVIVESASKTGYVLQAVGPLCGSVSTALSVTKTTTESVSATWTGTDTLTISHPTAASTTDAQVTSGDPQYHAAKTNTSASSITVKFYDISSGAAYTGASPPCAVSFSRSGTMAKYPISGAVETMSSRGPGQIPASALAGSSRNLWLFGIFEID